MSITPLHVHSGYSLLRCPTGLDALIARAAGLGHGCLALTDVNNLYAATLFHAQARQAGLKPIIGAELRDDHHAVVALSAGAAGYENLCQILTRIRCGDATGLPSPAGKRKTNRKGHEDHEEPQENEKTSTSFCLRDLRVWGTRLAGALRARLLVQLSEGLHFIVEDDLLAQGLLAEGMNPGRLWLGLDPPTQRHAQVRRLVDCGESLGLGLLATGKAMFGQPDDYEVLRLLLAIRTGSTFDAIREDQLPSSRACLRGADQLQEELSAFPAAVANNQRLAEECSAYRLLPRGPVFPKFPCPDGLSAEAYLRRLSTEGMKRRYGRAEPAAAARLEKELNLIRRMGFCEYFLVVWDIVRYARERHVPVAGRGSGASSIVAYLLGITNVCPLAFDIPFERFLNERRGDFPDLDVDFCWRIRDDVIDYAFNRWGSDHVAMVCTHNTFGPSSALRETAKAMGLSDDRISRLDEADLNGGGIVRLSRRIVNLPHNLSVHPGGIVISPRTIDHYVPIQPAAKGVTVTQYDKNGVEDIGLVKLDLLGNRSLSTIRCACDLIATRTGRTIDIETLPPADPSTIAVLQAARTIGCNQLESPAMRHLLKALQPRHVRDVMKALALIRPGAASIGMKEVFIRRRRGLQPTPTGHPQVDRVLRDTSGVMLYEDDVMLVAAALMGAPLSEADRFRKAVQKCPDDRERLRLSREFLSRCIANGVDGDYAKGLWVQMAKFNAYSFCRAHAASYAMPAYAVAWLKTHYPLEFHVAALNNNQSMYHPRVYVEQAKREGVRFLLPDIHRSGDEFTAEGDAIRVGLGRIAGLGPVSVRAILEARNRRPFAGLGDCLRRTRLGYEEGRSLVLCGALDASGWTRPALMMELNLCLARRAGRAERGDLLLPSGLSVPDCAGDYPPHRKYADERRILGFSVREHIMEIYRPGLAGLVDTDSRQLEGRVGRRIRIAGVLEANRTTRTQKGGTMRFLTMEDELGLFEVTVFPGARVAGSFNRYGPYLVRGKVEEQYDAITVTADTVELVEARQPVDSPAASPVHGLTRRLLNR